MRQATVGCGVVVILCLLAAGPVNAQIEPPQELLFAEMPEEVKLETQKLFSADQAEQIAAAKKLGEMGAKAEPAIEYMINVLEEKFSSSVRQAV